MCVRQEDIGDHKRRKTGMPQNIQPSSTLQSGAKQAVSRKHAWKCQHPRDQYQRCEKVSVGQNEQGTRALDGELRKQQDRGDQIDDEHRHRSGFPTRLQGAARST